MAEAVPGRDSLGKEGRSCNGEASRRQEREQCCWLKEQHGEARRTVGHVRSEDRQPQVQIPAPPPPSHLGLRASGSSVKWTQGDFKVVLSGLSRTKS